MSNRFEINLNKKKHWKKKNKYLAKNYGNKVEI